MFLSFLFLFLIPNSIYVKAEKCSLCSGFDDTLAIPNNFHSVSVASSCTELKTKITETNVQKDSDCEAYDILSFAFCGCRAKPRTESCFVCPNGEIIPHRMYTPGADAFVASGMGRSTEMGNKTCNDLAYSTSLGYLKMKQWSNIEDGHRRLNGGRRLGGHDMNLEQLLSLSCLPVSDLCGCSRPKSSEVCQICENGLENPDFVPIEDDEGGGTNGSGSIDEPWTCAKGIEGLNKMAQSMSTSDANCDQFKKQVKDSGCVCSSNDDKIGGIDSTNSLICQKCGSEDAETTGVSDECFTAVTKHSVDHPDETIIGKGSCENAVKSSDINVSCKTELLEYFKCSGVSAISLTGAIMTLAVGLALMA